MNDTPIWIACGLVLVAIATSHHFLSKGIKHMAVNQATFDADLAALVTGITGYVTAAQAKITALENEAPPNLDLSAEDASVATASTALATALGAINPVAAPAAPAAAAAVTAASPGS